MLSSQQIAQYQTDGYVIPDFQFAAADIEAIKHCHDSLLAKHAEFHDYCPALLDLDRSFLPFCLNQTVVDMVGQLIGQNVALWNASFFAKPALNGKRTPWHQDGEYWPIVPLATCTVWLAIDDSTEQNGCLRVIKGSHKSRALRAHNRLDDDSVTLNQALDPSEYDEAEAVSIELKAGQMSLHDVYLLHGSQANVSAHSRRGMTMRFMPTSSVFDREKAARMAVEKQILDHSARSVFLVSGRDLSGRNQLIDR